MVPLSSKSEAERLCGGKKSEILCNEECTLKTIFTTLLITLLISDTVSSKHHILRFYNKMLSLLLKIKK